MLFAFRHIAGCFDQELEKIRVELMDGPKRTFAKPTQFGLELKPRPLVSPIYRFHKGYLHFMRSAQNPVRDTFLRPAEKPARRTVPVNPPFLGKFSQNEIWKIWPARESL
jgi:hypothetical protein